MTTIRYQLPHCNWIQPEFGFAVILFSLTVLISGCQNPSLIKRGLLSDLIARQHMKYHLGKELVLSDGPVKSSTSLMTKDGRAHVFFVNQDSQLHHIELSGETILNREVLGVIETSKTLDIDAIEDSHQTLRVLAGDHQFIRTSSEHNWHDSEGNKCTRFIPIADELFCAFVISGKEVSAPKRTDWTVGVFFLLPVVFWSNEQAEKLVFAQESKEGWIIRAVVDPDITSDTSRDFFLGIDKQGTLQILYTTTSSGLFFMCGPGPGFCAGQALRSGGELRYAHISGDQLVQKTKDDQKMKSAEISPSKWLSVTGSILPPDPAFLSFPNGNFVRTGEWYHPGYWPLVNHFTIDWNTGLIKSIMRIDYLDFTLTNGSRELKASFSDDVIVEASIEDESWTKDFDVIAATDYPDSSFNVGFVGFENALIKTDSRGDSHILAPRCVNHFFGQECSLHYYVKAFGQWMPPISLGSCPYQQYNPITITVSSNGKTFASWLNQDNKFVGRWVNLPGLLERDEITHSQLTR